MPATLRPVSKQELPSCVNQHGAVKICRHQEDIMKREIIRVEPLSTYLEKWKAPTSAVTRHGNTIYVSGLPPFDPATGEIVKAPIDRQTELVLDQMKLCLETAGRRCRTC
jgi:enamine deaminase RidA (YjgF/YER057c/UK114 family)